MPIAQLVVEGNADLRRLYRELDRGTAYIQRFASSVKSAGTAMSIGLTLPLVGLGVAVGRAAADMDSLRRGLASVAGSSAAAEEQLKRLEDIARLPGLGFREAIQGSVRLQAVGLSVALTERALRSFGNAVALTGGGKAELDRITVQLGQLSGKGRVLAQDMRLIMDAAPATGRALREAFGTTDTEAIQKLGLTTEQFLTRLFDALDRLPRVTGGVKNSFENLTDSLFRAKVAIGEQLIPVVVPLVEGLTRMLEGARSLNPETVRWGIAIAAVAAAAGPLLFLVGQLTIAVTALTAALGIAGLAGTVATGGVLLVLGALAALFVKNKLDALAAGDAIDRFKNSLVNLNAEMLAQGINQRTAALSNLENARRVMERQLAAATASKDLLERQAPAGILGMDVGPSRRRDALGNLRPGFLPTPPDFNKDSLTAARANVERLSSSLRDLEGEYQRVRQETRLMGEQFNASTKATTSTPLVPTGGGGRDKLAGLVDSLTDRLRELAVLQKFNVPSLDLLPDNIQEQVRLVDRLGNELDTLQDGLRRFQQAGRTPPQQLTWGIDVLRGQLRSARTELKALADEFQMKARVGFVNGGALGTQVRGGRLLIPGIENIRLPERDLNRLASGPAARSGGLLGGELPSFAGLVALVKAGETAAAASLGLSMALGGLREVVTQVGRSMGEFGRSQLRNAVSGVAAMAAQFTPAGLAAYALSQAMEALRPVLEAVLMPVKIFGEIIAISVTPVLRLLFPVLKALAIILSYVQEAFDRVIGTLLKGIGWFVRAIGKIVNFLDPFGNPGNGLVKLGNSLRDSASSFFDAADEIKKKRKELQGLSFDDALAGTTDSLNRLTESVLNAVQGFKVAKFRFEASDARVPTEAPRSSNLTQAPGLLPPIGELHIHAVPGEDMDEFLDRFIAAYRRRARSVPSMQPFAAQLG